MRRIYIWQASDWPAFRYDAARLITPLRHASTQFGIFAGILASASAADQHESELLALTADAVDTSAIEGEKLNPAIVRESIVRRLSLPGSAMRGADEHTEGVVDMTLDAICQYRQPVTAERLFEWHEMLFPIVRNRRPLRVIGEFRDDANGPMTVQTDRGAGRTPTIHYLAPPALHVPRYMDDLLEYIEAKTEEDGLIRAAIVHLWFLLIHPFEDGNGRIGRALADLMLARALGPANRYCSLSRQILIDRKSYYEVLERFGHRSSDVTDWIVWFLDCYARAAQATIGIVSDVLRAARFFSSISGIAMNDRQLNIVKRLLDGFVGKMNAGRYARMTGTSHDTANRDLADLVTKGVLIREGESKKTNYRIRDESPGRCAVLKW